MAVVSGPKVLWYRKIGEKRTVYNAIMPRELGLA